jgi:catechol 2,3-dioxygenase-like lactoylglutathione lyase family enzyme
MSRIFGPIRQNGYVVRDIEAALAYWTEVAGVGPFWYIDRVPIEHFHYRGEPSDIEVSIALGNTGPLQIELIQQRNDAPSMYRDFLAAGHEGLQHVAYWTDHFERDLERARAAGFRVAQSGEIGENGRFVYFESRGHPGSVIELSEINGTKGAFFARIAEAAAAWDGSDPIRGPIRGPGARAKRSG